MAIACLGWGSLIWDQRKLPVSSLWFEDGPSLPVEFARQSNNGRITLVFADGVAAIPVLWCTLSSATPKGAFDALVEREEITAKDPSRVIGLWKKGDQPTKAHAKHIGTWAASKNLDAVVWTALGPKFSGKERLPSCEEVVAYLSVLTGDKKALAQEYVCKAPKSVRTAYRSAIEKTLGWTPLDSR